MTEPLYPDTATAERLRRTVLVVVVNNRDDLRRAAAEGWYRIPQRRSPRRIGADYLAFYQTGAFKGEPEAQSVTFYAPTRRYRLCRRRELLPDDADHPRADDYYFRIDLGPFQRLEAPIRSATMRRITFIHTTLEQLLTAIDVRELFPRNDPFETLWHTLRENRLRPLTNRLVDDWPVDIALRARNGYLGIRCSDGDNHRSAQERHTLSAAERWEILAFSAVRLEQDMDGCLRQIGAALINLGGSIGR